MLNWTNFKPNRAHWLVGFPILMAFGCTFIHGGVHTRTHVYWGRGIHYRGCTFIPGGVHTRIHVYWGGASTTGGVPSYLGVYIPGHMCTGGGASTTGVYLHSWGCAYQDTCTGGEASTTGGVPSYLGVCIPGRISCHNQSKISSHLN